MSNFSCKFVLVLFTFFLSVGCSRAIEDYQEEGEGTVKTLIHDLKLIRTRDQLTLAAPKLQKHFDRLVQVMISAREFQMKQLGPDKGFRLQPNHELSDELRIELNRIYQIEGGRQIIEKSQEQALNRLDAFEKKISRN